ncbi:response regulator transcription factor [Penaeicola halotolerans]|uniref:response regulator transcription factor n=1 Tax=Penaeicola halotolerans TaxID=2793196 RepID=UPI001CF847D7|nr:response regulator transcription factor [Penaeicola halotolerans]
MIRLVLADDHTLFAEGVANLLRKESDFEVQGVFNNGLSALRHLEKMQSDIILLDLNMPDMDGIATLKEIKSRRLPVKVIILSMYDEENIFKSCEKEGISAYILKDADPDELIYIIREVFEDRHLLSYQRVLKQVDEDAFYDSYKKKLKLSRREIEILKLIKDGKTNNEIAEELFLSVFTVETHRKNINAKIGAKNLADLIRVALELNL